MIKKKTILIIGGYGGTGKIVARTLLRETSVNVVIAGRRKEKAEEISALLNQEFHDGRASACFVDTDNKESVTAALPNVDLVILATTTPESCFMVAEAALNAGIDYLDFLFNQETFARLSPLKEKIVKAKRIFITQAGFHPGLPAVFVREGANYFDRYDTAVIGMAMNARFEKPESTIDLVKVAREFDAEIFDGENWRKATFRDFQTFQFPPPFGKKKCFPLRMEELKSLPKRYYLKELGTYVAGFNWFVDNFVFPLIMLFHKVKKNSGTVLFTKLIYWGVNTFSPKQHKVVFLLEAEGLKDGQIKKVKIIAEHDDPFLFTAAPIVACIKQYLAGTIKKPGLHFMGHIVNTKKLFEDLKKMGIRIKVEES